MGNHWLNQSESQSCLMSHEDMKRLPVRKIRLIDFSNAHFDTQEQLEKGYAFISALLKEKEEAARIAEANSEKYAWDFTFAPGDTIREKLEDLALTIKQFMFRTGDTLVQVLAPISVINDMDYFGHFFTKEQLEITKNATLTATEGGNKVLFRHKSGLLIELSVLNRPWVD